MLCLQEDLNNEGAESFPVSMMNGLFRTIFCVKLSHRLNQFCSPQDLKKDYTSKFLILFYIQSNYITSVYCNNRNYLSAYTSFHHAKTNMASSSLRKMLYLPKSYLPQMAKHMFEVRHGAMGCNPLGRTILPTLLWQRMGLWPIVGWQQLRHYLRWRAKVSCRTSSQMWGSSNLPMYLLRDWSLTWCTWPPWWCQ